MKTVVGRIDRVINTFKVIVSGFVLNKDNELLVIRRSKDEESFPDMLAIPGGTVEVNATGTLEKDVVENTLIREVLEETNVKVRVCDWMESTAIVKGEPGKLYLFFTCELIDEINELQTSEETPAVFWSSVHALDVNQCTPTLREYVEKHL
ncbi:MAG: NUDIX hydrolase [Candidatus Saccharimonas sp.]